MKKAANEVDRHVGGRVRLRRMMIGMSQEKLGTALGLTFQQVQKYEKGTNRISASRLQQMSSILGVGIDYFYAGAPGIEGPADGSAEGRGAYETGGDPALTAEGLKLLRAFHRIREPKIRRRLLDLATALSAATEPARPL